MKSILTFVITVFLVIYSLHAQTIDAGCINNINSINKCNLNLIDEQYTNEQIGLAQGTSYGNGSIMDAYRDVKYSQCTDGSMVACTSNENALVYDVYYPIRSQQDLANCGSPAVVLFHGGSYTDCGTFRSPQTDSICRHFAKRGMVTFNVEYRRGVKIDLSENLDNSDVSLLSAQQIFAIYRGIQDVRGALRSILRRQIDGYAANLYNINPDYLFVGGGSAGGVIAMSAVYYNQAMLDTVFRTQASLTAIEAALGPIDADYYYAPPAAAYDFKQKVKAVFNWWGGLIIPYNRNSKPLDFFSDYLSTFTAVPAYIGFHGEEDHTFNYKQEFSYYTTTSGYKTESTCPTGVSYTLPQLTTGNGADRYQLGSYGFATNVLTLLGTPSEIYLDKSMAHDIKDGDDDFGTGFTNSAQTFLYLVQRVVTYCQALVHGNASSLNKTVFEDCENLRHGCLVSQGDLNDSYDCTKSLP